MIAGRIARVPVILTSRLQLSRHKQGRRWMQWIERRANRRTTAILANSEAVARDTIEHEGVDPRKIRVIHNGVATGPFDRADPRCVRRELGIGEDAFVIIAVANLHPL